MKRHFPILIVCILFHLTTRSQPFQCSVFSLENEFSKGLIKAISVDNQGFVWIASDEGLIRYDGKQSLFFKNDLPGGFAKSFCKRKDGSLLVLHDFGLTEIISEPDTTYFKSLLTGENADSQNALFYPKTIYEDQKKNIWIGENQSIIRYKNGDFKKFSFGDNSKYDIILSSYSFTEDDAGNLWAISHKGILYNFDESKDQFVAHELPSEITFVNSLHFHKSNILLAGTHNGLFEIEFNSNLNVSKTSQLNAPEGISTSVKTESGAFYIGTWDKGVFRSDLSKEQFSFEKIELLPFEETVGLYFDKKNGLWAAGSENVALISPVFFTSLELAEMEIVKSIQLMKQEQILLIKNNDIVSLKKEGADWVEKFITSAPEQAPTIVHSVEKGIWFGDLSGRVFFYDYDSKTVKTIQEIQFSSYPIEHILEDQKGNIWIAGNSTHGLIRIAKDERLYFYNNDGLNTSKVIYETSDGRLFVGGGNPKSYLFSYDYATDSFEDLSIPIEFAFTRNFYVEDIISKSKDALWLATFEGVLEYRLDKNIPLSEKLKRIDLRKVPLDEPAKALSISEDGTVWVSTTSGLIGYYSNFSLLFDKTAGLPGNNLYKKGLLADPNKNLWVATTKGLAYIHQPILKDRTTPRPLFRRIKINGTSKLFQKINQEAFPFHTAFEIEFSTPSYPSDNVSYQTRILELDTVWSAPIYNPQFLLTGLPSGDYTFQVRAQQKSGLLWSPPNSFYFSINSPWYQKWWVLLLSISLGGVLIYGFARLYNLNLIRQNEKLESIIEERTAELNRRKNEIIEHKNKQVTTYALQLIQKNEALKELRTKIFKSIRGSDKASYHQLKSFLEVIDFSFRNDDEWEKFQLYFEEVHAGFFEKLMSENPNITPHDLRHCALIKLNLSIQEVATVMGISGESVKTSRFRLRKKMEIDSQQELVDYIMKI